MYIWTYWSICIFTKARGKIGKYDCCKCAGQKSHSGDEQLLKHPSHHTAPLLSEILHNLNQTLSKSLNACKFKHPSHHLALTALKGFTLKCIFLTIWLDSWSKKNGSHTNKIDLHCIALQNWSDWQNFVLTSDWSEQQNTCSSDFGTFN